MNKIKIPIAEYNKIVNLYCCGVSKKQIAKKYDVAVNTISYVIDRHRKLVK